MKIFIVLKNYKMSYRNQYGNKSYYGDEYRNKDKFYYNDKNGICRDEDIYEEFEIDTFYFNEFKNEKNWFTCSNRNKKYSDLINNEFKNVFSSKIRSNILVDIYKSWKNYNSISEKQLGVLLKCSRLKLDYYTYTQYKELIVKLKRGKEIENIKNVLQYKCLSKDCLSIVLKYLKL
jgi:hypothetical protein